MARTLLSLLSVMLVLPGCNPSSLVMDPGVSAVSAGDYTLLSQACNGVAPGLDSCLVKEGAELDATWNILIPKSDRIVGGDISVSYRDFTKSYVVPAKGGIIPVSLKEILGHDKWDMGDRGSMVALATVQYKGNQVTETVRMRALLILVVTDVAYDPLPIGSPMGALKSHCDISYSTAGRSSVSCK